MGRKLDWGATGDRGQSCESLGIQKDAGGRGAEGTESSQAKKTIKAIRPAVLATNAVAVTLPTVSFCASQEHHKVALESLGQAQGLTEVWVLPDTLHVD